MSKMAWEEIIQEYCNSRTVKPRETGVTMVIDTGLGIRATEDIIEISGDFIDHWKCSFGTSAFVKTDVLKRKLALLKASDIMTYPGGTLLEAAVVNQHCRPFMMKAKDLGFSAVEISDGTIHMTRHRRNKIIKCALDAGLIAITEVGKKDPSNQPTASEVAEQVIKDINAGASWVIIEGRESGVSVGIYDELGGVNTEAFHEIIQKTKGISDKLIWETPQKGQQATVILNTDANVSLGNINPEEMLALESLRAGLRFETLNQRSQEWEHTGRWNPDKEEPVISNNKML